MNVDMLVADIKRQTAAGELVGRKWAEEQASIRDMERIYEATASGWCGVGALTHALCMDEGEVQACCFGSEAYSLCFAEGFVRGVTDYFEECDDGMFFDE
jgi:hypothetical protein